MTVFGFALTTWTLIGYLGQAMFSMRFIVQWAFSEKARRSIIPTAFWYFSVAGGVTLLAYAIHREDPVFIVGQGAGLIIYGRNLYFIHRRHLARLFGDKGKPAAAQQGPQA